MRSWLAILGLVVGMKLLSMFAVAGSAGAESTPPEVDAPLADAGPADVPFPVPDAAFDAPAAAQPDDGCGVAGGGGDALVLVLAALTGARRRKRPTA